VNLRHARLPLPSTTHEHKAFFPYVPNVFECKTSVQKSAVIKVIFFSFVAVLLFVNPSLAVPVNNEAEQV